MLTLVGSLPITAEDFSLTLEAEDAVLTSVEATTKVYNDEYPGFTGTGFAWMTQAGSVSFNIDVPVKAAYKVVVRGFSYLEDDRLQRIDINGVNKGTDFIFPASKTWLEINLGVFPFKEGENTFEIKANYGYILIDSITITQNPYTFDVTSPLVDENATDETKALNSFLQSIYGKHVLSGQQEMYGGGHDGNLEYEFDWIYDLTGELPAARGFDFMNYNPIYGWEDGTTERIIEWDEKSGIATGCWHINVPKDWETYTLGDVIDWEKATYKQCVPSTNAESTFDVRKAVVKGTKEYDYFQECIKMLAEQFLILQENDVPLIWRPFHECAGQGQSDGSGAWFWWTSGGAETYKELWKLLYTELTETYGVHNLIWTFNYDWVINPDWYPGDDYVDILSHDKYNTEYHRTDGGSGANEDADSANFYTLVDLGKGKKMVAMTENDTIPSVENLIAEEAWWLLVMPWYDNFLTSPTKNNPDTLKTFYQSDLALTLDEIQNWKKDFTDNGNNDSETTSTASTTSATSTTSEPKDPTEPVYGDIDCDGEIAKIGDVILLSKHISKKLALPPNSQNYKNCNVNQKSSSADSVDSVDLKTIIDILIGQKITLPVTE
jgi:mannan endo-1,4-beta-mannosidase